ncbi:MAG: helix-hairpin-helix domain-containing protein [Desulfuromusa sp.]|nr:helix-hairpin-helix domain-containing protein [Desulfuromusa sp.]
MKNIKKFLLCSLLVVAMVFAYQPSFAAGKININTATAAQLVELKGIGSKTAEKIVEYRKKHKFSSVDELANVKGIGDKTLSKIRNQITVTSKKSKKTK